MLSRLALRICTVEALRGNTQFGDNVHDSVIGALDVAADRAIRTAQESPFIAVYTDESTAERDTRSGAETNLDIRALHRAGLTDLIIEIGMTAAMTDTDEDGKTTLIGFGYPATDENMEAALDLVAAQITSVLTDPQNAWSELWRQFVPRVMRVVRRRTSDATNTRIAAHQIVISADLLPDPIFGEQLSQTGTYAKFLEKLKEINSPWLPSFNLMIGATETQNSAVTQRRYAGTTLDEARALADFPVVETEDVPTLITSISQGS